MYDCQNSFTNTAWVDITILNTIIVILRPAQPLISSRAVSQDNLA